MHRDADLEPRVLPAITAGNHLPHRVDARDHRRRLLRHAQIQHIADGPELRAQFGQ